MIELGFQEEVEKLYQREDLHPDLPSIRCVGYRQMWEYLRGDYDHEEMVFRGYLCNSTISKTTNHLATRLENTIKLAR